MKELKKPDIEINKPGERKFWQRPNVAMWIYVLFMLASLYFWQSASTARHEEIPYSEFLQYVKKKQIAEAVVTDKMISGTLTLKDKKIAPLYHHSSLK